ncbi:MAG: hypothetical protein ACOX7I_08855 [Oscillospiraceae bacterium]|jgi:hypothetical protein
MSKLRTGNDEKRRAAKCVPEKRYQLLLEKRAGIFFNAKHYPT